jgi:flagellar hook assembly protein FlgD
VRALSSGELPAGYHRLAWDGSDAAGRRVGSGMYFVQARTAGGVLGQRIVWMP